MIDSMARKAPVAAGRRSTTERDERAALVLRKFRQVFNAVKTHFREVEKRAGVAGAQVWALSVIRDQPGIGVSALARALDIHQSTASNLLKPLLERGLVAAARAEGDRRSLQLHISVKGLDVLKKAPGPAAGLLPEALSHLDPKTLRRLDQDLTVVIALLNADRRASKIPLGHPGVIE
jgi:DNA-binding MarR family transcriptional regulator